MKRTQQIRRCPGCGCEVLIEFVGPDVSKMTLMKQRGVHAKDCPQVAIVFENKIEGNKWPK